MKADTNTARLITAGSPVASTCGVAVRAAAIVLVLCLFFVLSVGSASARVAHGFTSSFGEAGTGDGQFALQAFSIVSKEVRAGSGVAVDTKDGLVFVADTGNRRVDVFTTAGFFVRAFGADVGGAGVDVCTSGCHVGGGGSAPGELDRPAFVAVDEAAGMVYVGEESDGWVSKFTLAGELVASWGEGGRIDHSPTVENGKGEVLFKETAFEALAGVAVDGEGHLFVYNHFGLMFRLEPTGGFISLWESNTSASPAGIAVRGNKIFATYGDAIAEFTDAGGLLGFLTPMASQGGVVSGVGVDLAEGGLFVDEATEVSGLGKDCVPTEHILGPFCSAVERFGSLVSGVGVAVDPVSHAVFVGDAGLDRVDVFDAVLEGSTSPASEVTAHGARLNGTVNPYGAPVTSCRFEFGASEAYGGELPCEETPAEIGSGGAPVEVHANLDKLEGSTTYYYRLVVSNSQATVLGEGEQFTTLTLPAIDGAASEDVSASSALLAADIDPRGVSATYHFEWGTSTAYGHTIPVPDADAGAGTGDVVVAQTVTGLSANTEYHWRVVASNLNGTVEGVDHTFVYDTSGGGLPHGRAYEMVTPPSKNAALIGAVFQGFPPAIAEDGSSLMAASIQCFAGSQSCIAGRQKEGEPYLFSRGQGGWSASALAPPATQFSANTAWAVSPRTGMALFSMPSPPGGQDDYYARVPDGSFADIGPVSEPALGARGVDPISEREMVETADFSRVVWDSASVWPSFDETKSGGSLYEYMGMGNTAPSLVGVTGGPGSTDLISVCGTELGTGSAIRDRYGSLSENGEIVFFTALRCGTGSGENVGVKVPADELWARVAGSRSVLVSARSQSECSGACASSPAGAAAFEGASKDGSRVLFTSTQQLTDNASEDSQPSDTAAGGGGCSAITNANGCNLYMFEGAGSEDLASRRLIDVSAGDLSGQGPRVQGVMALSADGSHVYFVAKGVLTVTANQDGETARNGANNLYVYERDSVFPNGHTAFIAALPESDYENWKEGIENANVTPDGRFLVFTSHGALTADVTRSEGPAQVYDYDAQTGMLVRVSIGEHGFNDDGNSGTGDAEIVRLRGSTLPTAGYPRPDPTMSHDGSYVFFESPVGLTPQALNEVQIGTYHNGDEKVYAQNVYEYHSGQVYLISNGRDTTQQAGLSSVELLGSDATGANVFFTTADQLVPSDTDTQRDFYDARICTAASPCVAQAPPPLPPCLGEACHGIPAPMPLLAGMPTIAFEGQGNLTQASIPPATVKKTTRAKPAKCAKHKTRRHGRCVKARPGKASRKARRSSVNRGGR